MSENYAAMVEGGRVLGRVLGKPVYIAIVMYLARMRQFSHQRHSRTLEEIQKEICKNPDFKPKDINLNILEMLVRDGWIEMIQGKTKSLPEYEITEQGRQLALFLKDPVISVLFKL